MRTVIDLGALDVFRAYGLERSVSFTELTGGEIAVSHTPTLLQMLRSSMKTVKKRLAKQPRGDYDTNICSCQIVRMTHSK